MLRLLQTVTRVTGLACSLLSNTALIVLLIHGTIQAIKRQRR